MTPNYSLFTFDLDKMGPDIRFFYDPNTHKGLYTTVDIPPEYIIGVENIVAKGNGDKELKPDKVAGIKIFPVNIEV